MPARARGIRNSALVSGQRFATGRLGPKIGFLTSEPASTLPSRFELRRRPTSTSGCWTRTNLQKVVVFMSASTLNYEVSSFKRGFRSERMRGFERTGCRTASPTRIGTSGKFRSSEDSCEFDLRAGCAKRARDMVQQGPKQEGGTACLVASFMTVRGRCPPARHPRRLLGGCSRACASAGRRATANFKPPAP